MGKIVLVILIIAGIVALIKKLAKNKDKIIQMNKEADPSVPLANTNKKTFGPISAFEKYKRQVIQEISNISKGIPGFRLASYEVMKQEIPGIDESIKDGFDGPLYPVEPRTVANCLLSSYLSYLFTVAIRLDEPGISKEDESEYYMFAQQVFVNLALQDIYHDKLSDFKITINDLAYVTYVMFIEKIPPEKIVEYLEIFKEYISLEDYQYLVIEELKQRNVPVKDLSRNLYKKIKREYYFGLSNSGTFLPDITPPEVFAQKFANEYFEILNDNLKSRGLKPVNTSQKAGSSKGSSGIQSY